jgi:hypothetical protein
LYFSGLDAALDDIGQTARKVLAQSYCLGEGWDNRRIAPHFARGEEKESVQSRNDQTKLGSDKTRQ